jgi:hypothetical protein
MRHAGLRSRRRASRDVGLDRVLPGNALRIMIGQPVISRLPSREYLGCILTPLFGSWLARLFRRPRNMRLLTGRGVVFRPMGPRSCGSGATTLVPVATTARMASAPPPRPCSTKKAHSMATWWKFVYGGRLERLLPPVVAAPTFATRQPAGGKSKVSCCSTTYSNGPLADVPQHPPHRPRCHQSMIRQDCEHPNLGAGRCGR